MSTTSEKPNIHQGRNVKRFREMLGLKQDAFAYTLGENWSQKRISLIEAKETLEPDELKQIALALNISEDALKNFDSDQALNVISNTFHQQAFISSAGTFNINPIEKWLEVIEENKKLYERLLASEKEKVEILKGKN